MKNSEKVLVALLAFKRTAGVMFLVAILVAIPVTLALNQRTQSLQQQAAESDQISPAFVPENTQNLQIQTVPTSQASLDVNQDGRVDITDLNIITSCVNDETTCTIVTKQDLNGNGVINRTDYLLLLEQYQAQQ